MAIQPMNDDVQIIQHLSDNPNQDDGLSAAQMKEKFDAASVLIKAYLNGTLVPAVQQLQKALNNGEIIGVDDTLSIAGQAADAAAVGAELAKKADTSTVDAALAKKAEYVLLWSNASKTSSFAAQTITADASGYSYLMIVCGYGTSTKNGADAILVRVRPDGDGVTEVGLTVNFVSSTEGLVNPFRKLEISAYKNSFVFGAGHKGDGTENNAYCIPYYIYGIKGVNDP